jgi:hypothetical protein
VRFADVALFCCSSLAIWGGGCCWTLCAAISPAKAHIFVFLILQTSCSLLHYKKDSVTCCCILVQQSMSGKCSGPCSFLLVFSKIPATHHVALQMLTSLCDEQQGALSWRGFCMLYAPSNAIRMSHVELSDICRSSFVMQKKSVLIVSPLVLLVIKR